jgi:hypothetical protein
MKASNKSKTCSMTMMTGLLVAHAILWAGAIIA